MSNGDFYPNVYIKPQHVRAVMAKLSRMHLLSLNVVAAVEEDNSKPLQPAYALLDDLMKDLRNYSICVDSRLPGVTCASLGKDYGVAPSKVESILKYTRFDNSKY